MARCPYCGYKVPISCDGVQTWGVNPYADEISGDATEYLMCDGERYDAAREV